MARGKNRSINGRFVQSPWGFVGGDIWLLLTPAQIQVFWEMRKEWQRFTHGDYSKTFVCPYGTLNVARQTASTAIKRFIHFRFIEIVNPGGLFNNANEYRFLENEWEKYKLDSDERRRVDKIKREKAARQKKSERRRMQMFRDLEARRQEQKTKVKSSE